MRESKIQRACLDLLESLRLSGKPVKATRTNAGKVQMATGAWIRLCAPGWADITASIAGTPVMIECKASNGKQSADQIKCQREWEHAGGVYLIVNKMEILRNFLDSMGLL